MKKRNMRNLIKILALALALSAIFAATACKQTPPVDDLRFDVTVEPNDQISTGQWSGSGDDIEETFIDYTELVPRPERHLPFEPGEVGFISEAPDVNMIEINQCLSYGFDVDTGEFYLMQTFVSGKDTAIFVTFDTPFDMSRLAALTIERDGEVIAQLSPAGMPDEYTLLFQPRDMADVDYWAAGAYTFTFETDGGWAARTANFTESITDYKILAVPIRGYFSGNVESCVGLWREAAEVLISTYPIARGNIEYVLHPEVDLSGSRYDLHTDEGQYLVWEAITHLQTRDDEYTLIIGFVSDYMYPSDRSGTLFGFTCGMPVSIVSEANPELIRTLAHEVAHCYNIGDEYNGGSLNFNTNMPPYGTSGHIIWTYTQVTADNPNVIGGQSMGLVGPGSVVYEEQRPYWANGRQLLGTVTSYMGNGQFSDPWTRWVTSDVWNHLYSVFYGKPYMPPEDEVFATGTERPEPVYWGQCPNCYNDVYDPFFYVECWECLEFVKVTGYEFECPSCRSGWWLDDYEDDLYMECPECRYYIWYDWFEEHNSGYTGAASYDSAGAAQGVFTRITGFIDSEGGFTPSTWYTYETSRYAVTPAAASEYGAYVYDAAGTLLAVTHFNVETTMNIETETAQMFVPAHRRPVDISLRFPDNAARIVIKRGSEVLYSQNVSQNAPTVAFTGLTENQQLSNNFTLTWDAADADGDEIFFDIWYYPGADKCFNIAANITGRSLAVDLSEFPGTNAGSFMISATDGVLTTEAHSPTVKVPFKAPVIYTRLDGIPEFTLTDEINIVLDIYDYQDGFMWGGNPGTSIVWSGWPDGRESYNSAILWGLPFALPPGLHTFTCTVTNTAGLSSSMDYTFRVIDDDSALPNDWSRAEVRQALARSFVLPLDRLDAPVTRGDFAIIMANFYTILSGGIDIPFFDFYSEDAVIDCVADAWEPHFFDYLGIMEVTDRRFYPGMPVGELEAALIMFKVFALATNDADAIRDVDDVQAIIPVFQRLGIIDPSGPNAFNESERLTNRLAMVRLNRFFSLVYSDDTGVTIN